MIGRSAAGVVSLLVAIAAPVVLFIAPNARAADRFFVGVYTYEYQLAAAAEDEGQDYFAFVDRHLAVLHRHGVNAIYLGGTSRERFDGHLALAKKYDMRL